jgi:cell division protein ZapA
MVTCVVARNVHLRVAGQSYRVSTSGSVEELERLAAMVEAKLSEVTGGGRVVTPQAMLLVAISLAHELEAERARGAAVFSRTHDTVERALARLDTLVGFLGEDGSGAAE